MRAALLVLLFWVAPIPVAAQFAEPPAELAFAAEPDSPRDAQTVVRVHVGPALELSGGEAGLFTALDIGRGRVGTRLSGSAVALGAEGGSATATAELWLSAAELGPLRAVLGAGAGLRDESRPTASSSEHELAGIAVFRGGLELALPIDDADARAALSAAAFVPAVVESNPARASGQLQASLALGF